MTDHGAFPACIFNAMLLPKKHVEVILIPYLILKCLHLCIFLRKVNNVPFLKAIHSDYLIIHVILGGGPYQLKNHISSTHKYQHSHKSQNTTNTSETLSTIIH